jgi:GNAT superfamily N-acetyltransferase
VPVDAIRPGSAAEREQLEALQRRASLIWDEDRANILEHPDAIEVPTEHLAAGWVRVAVRNGTIVGFATLLPTGHGAGELDALFVEPDLMRQGIGHELIADLATVAREHGLRRIEVTGNPNARRFYEREGFVVMGEVPTRFRPGLRMHLDV